MSTLSSLIQLSTAFSAEIDLSNDFRYNLTAPDQKIEGYLPNRSSRRVMKAILDTVSTSTDHKLHLIQASYGTGKSYLMLMMAHLLGNNRPEALAPFLQKISDKEAQLKDGLSTKLEALTQRDDRFLVVIPNYGEADFRQALLKGLITALDKQGLGFRPPTMYQRAAEVLEGWKATNPTAYQHFGEKLSGVKIEDFIGLLRDLDAPSYHTFKTCFRAIVGNSFDESDVADAYTVYAETAKSIASQGYRGIVVLYDEFGDMLGRLINATEGSGLPVQKFIESVKRAGSQGVNILFIAATHQDPYALLEDKKKNLEKTSGRFDPHSLGATKDTLDGTGDDVEITDATEIMGTVFIRAKETKPKLDELLKAEDYASDAVDLVSKQNLYGKQTAQWISHNVVENLFPLHPLTARLLPKFSNEYAQNTRTMFNFLSPSQLEVGGLQHFLNTQPLTDSSGRPTLFTPDRLLDFFETNLMDAKFGQIRNSLDDYKTALANVTGEVDAERLFRNVLLLKVVRDNRLAPRRDLLLWAQNWPTSRNAEFDALLNSLADKGWLEHNRTNNTYDFPSAGTLSVDSVLKEEEVKLAGLRLPKCLEVWNSLEPCSALVSDEQNDRFGAQRRYEVVPICQASDSKEKLEKLVDFYSGKNENWPATGYVFHLVSDKPEAQEQMAKFILANKAIQPYVFYTQPNDPFLFSELQKKTLKYLALEAALLRDEIASNPARKDKVTDQFRLAERELRSLITGTFEPHNWVWNYATESTPQVFSNARGFNNWFEQKVEERFFQVPTVKEPGLWFVKRAQQAKDRDAAFANIYSTPTGRIPLDTPGNAAHDRIVEHFFYKLTLTKQTAREKGIQYGEIKSPDTSTPEASIFRHFDKVLKGKEGGVSGQELFSPLLQAPYGLSEHLIKFFFGCYDRLHSLQITIYKGALIKEKDAELFKELFKKPADYRIRRVDMSPKEEGYLRELRDLFGKSSATSFAEVARQFLGIVAPLTSLQKALIARKGGEVQAFFETIAALQQSIPEPEARMLFLETLPNSLLGITSQEAFEDDPGNRPKLLKKLREFKQFPVDADKLFRQETLETLAKTVFGEENVGKDDIQLITKKWFAGLTTAQRMATYSDPYIANWIRLIQNGPVGKDILSYYTSELTAKPLHTWEGNLYLCQSEYVKEFQGYKKTVEDFTLDPMKVLQYIAREVFEVSPSECPTETVFAALFKDWWTGLGQLKQTHPFADLAAKWLLENIDSTAPTTTLYLDNIPRRWIEKNNLLSSIPTKWKEWTDTQIAAVAAEYRRCYVLINAWQPPVAETDFFAGIGQLFGLKEATTAQVLREGIFTQWYANLPARTREAEWANKTSDDALLINQLSSGESLYNLLTQTLPQRWGLPGLKDISAEELPRLLAKIGGLKASIDNYSRPLLEVVSALDKKGKHKHEYDYKSALYDDLRRQEAYTVKADADATLLTDSLARLLLHAVRAKADLGKLVEEVALHLQLPSDHHLWDKDQQKAFVSSWNQAVATIQAWTFPEDRKLAEARDELSAFVREFCEKKDLNPGQRRKLLNDLLSELAPVAQAQ
ncbi:hypothetical protein GCM10023185_39600 [Hymenobacter saemangeumensis]|uniref:ATP-binding protein n=1 Tax=Hymenobacter saemangeumensis TaxID=1084522 RepID=A0ABP8IQT5_9BACT